MISWVVMTKSHAVFSAQVVMTTADADRDSWTVMTKGHAASFLQAVMPTFHAAASVEANKSEQKLLLETAGAVMSAVHAASSVPQATVSEQSLLLETKEKRLWLLPVEVAAQDCSL